MTTIYDVIIVGGGPAGLTAGLYASRARLKTLLIEKMGCGGQVVITDLIENYPGFPEGIGGFELATHFETQAKKFGLEVTIDEVAKIRRDDDGFVITAASQEYRCRSVILASGARFKTLDVPGEAKFRGRGVSYCATCDGPFFRGKKVVVVGGGDSALQEALFLTRFAESVALVHRRDAFRAARILQERVTANAKITAVMDSTVTAICGDDAVSSVEIKNAKTQTVGGIAADGVFIFVGWVPNTALVGGTVDLDAAGYVTTDDRMQTSVPGMFACGDVRTKMLRQVVTAAGDGAAAAFSAQHYLENL